MEGLSKVVQILVLFILTILCLIVGHEVFDRFDGGLFNHSAVPLEYSCMFLFLLIGIGLTLGFITKKSNIFSRIIVMWPMVHLIIAFILFIVGQASELILGLLLYSIVVLPINLIGEGISLGFQINRLFSRKGPERLGIIAIGFINLVVIIFVLYEISNVYLANIIL